MSFLACERLKSVRLNGGTSVSSQIRTKSKTNSTNGKSSALASSSNSSYSKRPATTGNRGDGANLSDVMSEGEQLALEMGNKRRVRIEPKKAAANKVRTVISTWRGSVIDLVNRGRRLLWIQIRMMMLSPILAFHTRRLKLQTHNHLSRQRQQHLQRDQNL